MRTVRLPAAARHCPGPVSPGRAGPLTGPCCLDLATAGSLTARGCAAIARHARLLLLDLTGLSFCDAPAGPGVHRAALCRPMKGCCHEHRL